MRRVVKLNANLGLERTGITKHKINVLGEDFVKPLSPVLVTLFYPQQVGDPDHREDFKIVLYRFDKRLVKFQFSFRDQLAASDIRKSSRSGPCSGQQYEREKHSQANPDVPPADQDV